MANRAEKRRRERQAHAGASGGGSGSGRAIYWILGGAVFLGGLVVGWNVVSSLLDDTVRAPVEVTFDTPQELVELAVGVEAGNPDAPVTIMEFSDYQCPACQDFFNRTKPFLDQEFVDTGQALFVYYDFPLVNSHANAFLAARAARCAGDQGGYWPFHDRVFQTQPEWAGMSDPVRHFEGLAQEVGLDRGEFRSCLRSGRHAETVSANLILGEQLGVAGTPTLILDTGEGRPVRVQDWTIQNFREVLGEVLAEVEEDEAGDPEGLQG